MQSDSCDFGMQRFKPRMVLCRTQRFRHSIIEHCVRRWAGAKVCPVTWPSEPSEVPVLPCDLHARFTGVLQRAPRERGAKLELSSKKVTLLPHCCTLPPRWLADFSRVLPRWSLDRSGVLVRFQLRVGEVRTSFDLVMSINDSKYSSRE